MNEEQMRAMIQNLIDQNRGQELPKAPAIGDVLVWNGDEWVPDRKELARNVGSSSLEPSFQGAWGNIDANRPVGFYKDPLGIVHLQGIALGTTIPSVIFNLPRGYWPALGTSDEWFPSVSVATFGAISVNGTTGAVKAEAGNTTGETTWITLSGITFRAAS